MNPTQLRDQASQLARRDAAAALQLARSVPDPWYRAQALAATARWIDADRVEAVARESLAAAAACDDDYQRAAVSAWPIRALLERGQEAPAREALQQARLRALAATPEGSQAEALFELLQGAWSLGAATRRQLIEDLVAVHERDRFWRVGRAVVGALAMLGRVDAGLAREIAARIGDDRCRKRAMDAISGDRPSVPRDYF